MNIGRRIEIAKDSDSILVHIKMGKNVFLLLFIPFWLIFWTLAISSVFNRIQSGDTQNGSVFIWLGGAIVGGIVISIIWLWNAFGREVLLIGKNNFIYKRELFGIALTKKTVPFQKLANLRVIGHFGSMFSFSNRMADLGFTGGTIAVDEGWDTHRFGNGLEEKEAAELVQAIELYFQPTTNIQNMLIGHHSAQS